MARNDRRKKMNPPFIHLDLFYPVSWLVVESEGRKNWTTAVAFND
jgi:hypothetical protein